MLGDVGGDTRLGKAAGGATGLSAGAILGSATPYIAIPTAGGYIIYKNVKKHMLFSRFHAKIACRDHLDIFLGHKNIVKTRGKCPNDPSK